MSIRTKTLLIISLTLLGLITVLYCFSQAILLQSYVDLEEETVTRNVQRALNATEEEIAFLRRTTLDYAHWDDTFDFIQGQGEGYIEANVFDVVMSNFALNFILFVSETGDVVYQLGYDPDAEAVVAIPDSLMTLVKENEALIRPRDENGVVMPDGVAGIVRLPEGGAILSSAPILPSIATGEPRGALIWGRYIDEGLVSRLAEQTALTLTMKTVTPTETEPDFVEVLPILLNQQTTIQPRSSEIIEGYTLLRDIDGQPAQILEVVMPRSIYQQGQNSLSYFLGSLVLVGVISAGAIGVMLERVVLSRLEYLTRHVTQIQASGDIASRVSLKGSDELTSLATSVNAMLETLQAQEKIKLARDNALEAARIKAEILANVSHDARTPLTVIQLRTDMMLNGIYGPLTERQSEILRTIMISAQQLLGFANNLLEGAQLEIGRLQLRIEPLEPRKLLETIRTTLSPLAERKNLCLETIRDDDLPEILYGDDKRLIQIMTNLISNAIKFTTSGEVTARLYRHDGDHWGIQIKDTGKGISLEHQTQIFSPFWQVDSSKTRSANSGVGLGLAIVQQLTELMNGKITVQSEVGTGTCFTVILPMQYDEKGTEYGETPFRLRN